MKSTMIAMHVAHRAPRTSNTIGIMNVLSRVASLTLLVLASALPAVVLVLLVTWVANNPVVLPAVQAATGLSGLVFLALAIDSSRLAAVFQLMTATAMFAIAWVSMAVSAEVLVAAAVIVGTWLGGSLLFLVIRRLN